MNTLNHIIIHVQKIDSQHIVRIIPVEYSKDYKEECTRLYPDISFDFYRCIYNSAQWCDRLIDDLKYKKFRNATLVEIKRGLWTVEADIATFFSDQLIPYIMIKLQGYHEDDDSDESYIQKLSQLKSLDNLNIDKYVERKYCETNKRNIYCLTLGEKTDSNIYIFSPREIYCLILSVIEDAHLVWPSSDENDAALNNSSDVWGAEYRTNSFTADEIGLFLQSLGICEKDVSDFKSSKQYLKYLQSTIHNTCAVHPYEGWAPNTYDFVDDYKGLGCTTHEFGVGEMIDSIGQTHLDKIGPGISLFEINDIQSVDEFKQYMTKKMEKAKSDSLALADKDNKVYVYSNIITQNTQFYDTDIKWLPEFKLINDVSFSTTIGKAVLNVLQNTSVDLRCKNIVKDIETVCEILGSLQMKPILEDKPKDVAHDLQRHYTKQYVDKYKNENAETLASRVIETLFIYLSHFIEPKDINMNKIGQDLVELGVKKMRKARGNVYNIDNPSKEDILVNLNDKSRTTNNKKNHQLRVEPSIDVNKAKTWPWNISSDIY